jgi:hypothetical protein
MATNLKQNNPQLQGAHRANTFLQVAQRWHYWAQGNLERAAP